MLSSLVFIFSLRAGYNNVGYTRPSISVCLFFTLMLTDDASKRLKSHWRRSQYASYATGVAVVKVLRQRYVLA